MAITDLGIVKADFETIFSDFSRSVVRTPVTKTLDNTTGAPTYTQGTTETIQAYVTKRGTSYNFDKEGLEEQGDALMMTLESQAVNKEDLIEVNGETYRVNNVILRTPGGEDFFNRSILFKVE